MSRSARRRPPDPDVPDDCAAERCIRVHVEQRRARAAASVRDDERRVDLARIEPRAHELERFRHASIREFPPSIRENGKLPQCEVNRFLAQIGLPASLEQNGPPGDCGP